MICILITKHDLNKDPQQKSNVICVSTIQISVMRRAYPAAFGTDKEIKVTVTSFYSLI